jgi:predicted membrane metal-binding protein
MTMEAQSSQDGRTRISLGPVERWIVTILAGALVGGGYWLVTSVQSILTQQQVTNQQLQTINVQMADVPALKIELAKQAVQVEQNKQDIRELKQLRGLK